MVVADHKGECDQFAINHADMIELCFSCHRACAYTCNAQSGWTVEWLWNDLIMLLSPRFSTCHRMSTVSAACLNCDQRHSMWTLRLGLLADELTSAVAVFDPRRMLDHCWTTIISIPLLS